MARGKDIDRVGRKKGNRIKDIIILYFKSKVYKILVLNVHMLTWNTRK